jgi:hypothetical protein
MPNGFSACKSMRHYVVRPCSMETGQPCFASWLCNIDFWKITCRLGMCLPWALLIHTKQIITLLSLWKGFSAKVTCFLIRHSSRNFQMSAGTVDSTQMTGPYIRLIQSTVDIPSSTGNVSSHPLTLCVHKVTQLIQLLESKVVVKVYSGEVPLRKRPYPY